MNVDEEEALSEAMNQLSDIAAGDLDGATVAEQIAMTREALADASKALTSMLRRDKRKTRS